MVLQGKWIVKIVFLCLLLIIKVLDAEEADILFSNEDDIRLFKYGSQTYTPILGGLNSVRSLDYDFEERRLFFIDLQNLERTVIKSKFLDKDDSTTIVVDSAETGETEWKVLAVDWITKKLYFTDDVGNRVEVTHYDGSCRKVLVSSGLDQPNGIALFPQKGLMFITDWGDTKKIERFNMDGTDRKVLVKIRIGWPESVTVDYETSTIYWGDKIHTTIMSMTIDGKNQTKHYSKTQPIYMTISLDRIFWSNTESISSLLKSGKNKTILSVKSFDGNNIRPLDLKVFSKYRQLPVKTDCTINNGNCSHLCLLKPGGITCACPTGIALKEDKKTCEDGMTKFIVFARRNSIQLLSLDVDKTVAFRLDVDKKHTKNVCGVTYDIEKQRVYWADSGCIQQGQSDMGNPVMVCNEPGSIKSVFLDGTGYEQFITNDIKDPDHLVIDWIARNLYWTDAHLARIEVANLDRSSRKIIISDHLNQPRGIAIDPADGKIYWTDWGTSRIESADLNGDNREVLVKDNIKWPNGITIDLQTRKLYWAEPSINSLFSYDLHKRVVTSISDEADHPFGVTVLGDYLYWTDWFRKVSKIRISKESGKKASAEVLFDGISDLMGISSVDTNINYGTNPCHYNRSKCSDLCFHKPKIGPVCECPTRKELHKDEKTCYIPAGFLLYAMVGSIHKTSIDTYKFSHRLPFSDTSQVNSLDVDYQRERIIWVNSDSKLGDYGIFSTFVNGSGFTSVRTVDVEHVENIAVDWMAGNLYWTNKNRIEVAWLDGSHHKILIYGEKVLKPELLMVNPHIRKVYWTQVQESDVNTDSVSNINNNNNRENYRSLWEANLDGTGHKELIGKFNPISCTINYNTDIIYCCISNQSHSIVSFNPSTRQLKTVLPKTPMYLGLKVFQDHLIYNYALKNQFQRISLKEGNSTTPETLFELPSEWVHEWLHDVTVYHQDAQTGSNACSKDNGGCQQLCFAMTSETVKCECETHYTLSTNGKTCEEPSKFLIGKQESSFLRFVYDSNKPESILSIPNDKGVQSIVFDEIRNYVYWLQPDMKRVIRVKQGETQLEPIPLVSGHPQMSKHKPYDFAVDPFSNSLFWTDESLNTINHLQLNSRANGTILQQTVDYFPRKIVVYPEGGTLFWTSKDVVNKRSAIYSSLFTGTDVKLLIRFGRKSELRDITIDYVKKRIFYLDTGLSHIGSISFQGQAKQDITLDQALSPVSIAVHGTYVLWADTRYIYKFNQTQDTDRKQKLPGKYDGLSKIVAVNLTRSQMKNPCLDNNGGCSHICRIEYGVSLAAKESSTHAKCGCPIQQRLDDKNSKNCSTLEKCAVDEFFCQADSKCIPLKSQCDGKIDCSDSEDEHDKDCEGVYLKIPCNIAEGYKRCGTALKCERTGVWCNKEVDCPDAEDEDETVCKLSNCKPDSFRCGGPGKTIICFDNSKRCDGLLDCEDRTDEKNCPSPTQKHNNSVTAKTSKNENSRFVAAIVSGAIVCLVFFVFGIIIYLRIRNSKNNASNKNSTVAGVWPLTELRSSLFVLEEHTKSSVSTYISNDVSYYEHVKGQSEIIPQHIFNPPPSPATECMSTITESNNTNTYSRYLDGQCDHCNRSIIGEQTFHLNETAGRDAPPPTEVSSLMHEVDMYCPLNQSTTMCEDCHSRMSSNNGDMSGRLSRHGHPEMRCNGHLRNGVHKPINELDFSNDWMYDDEVDDANLDTHYGEEILFIDSNLVGRHLFDPPPSPCTYYERPSSPTNTEQSSMAFSVLHGRDTHTQFAPPPSPTSQLL